MRKLTKCTTWLEGDVTALPCNTSYPCASTFPTSPTFLQLDHIPTYFQRGFKWCIQWPTDPMNLRYFNWTTFLFTSNYAPYNTCQLKMFWQLAYTYPSAPRYYLVFLENRISLQLFETQHQLTLLINILFIERILKHKCEQCMQTS